MYLNSVLPWKPLKDSVDLKMVCAHQYYLNYMFMNTEAPTGLVFYLGVPMYTEAKVIILSVVTFSVS